jgi:hypothetical protein
MKLAAILFCTFSLMLLLLQTGCEPSQVATEPMPGTFYVLAKVHILPLTEIVQDRDTLGQSEVKIYVSLLDSSGSQMKAPAVFRFELYEYAQRSSEPKGRRIAIWPDIDLTEPAENNKYWRDFLRAYEFNLPFEAEGDRSCIIQATCLCPSGKRLSAEFTFKNVK